MRQRPQLRTILANLRNVFVTRGSVRANKSSSENFPHECYMFRPVKHSPHFGHFQSGFIFLTADFADDADFCRLSDI